MTQQEVQAVTAVQVPEWQLACLRPCGDSGCILLSKKSCGGQHTNGGCQHLKERGPGLTKLLHAMAAEILRLRGD